MVGLLYPNAFSSSLTCIVNEYRSDDDLWGKLFGRRPLGRSADDGVPPTFVRNEMKGSAQIEHIRARLGALCLRAVGSASYTGPRPAMTGQVIVPN